MTPELRAHLRALAARVRTEEPSEALRDAVLIALGWKLPIAVTHEYWSRPNGSPCHIRWLPNPLTSLDAAAALMPEGCLVSIDQGEKLWTVAVDSPPPGYEWICDVEAPTEPRARTSAALEAMAAEGEA